MGKIPVRPVRYGMDSGLDWTQSSQSIIDDSFLLSIDHDPTFRRPKSTEIRQ